MFNVETFQNDMQKRTVPGSASQFAADTGKRAILYVFTPAIIPSQFLRPYKYDFNGNLVDQIVTAKEKMNCAVAPNGLGISSDLVNKSILPTPNGIPLNTSVLQTQWTFVLIADTSPNPAMRRSALSPSTRIIATGFCSDEPVNRTTMAIGQPTINPSAILMFTKTNTTYVTPQMGKFGVHNNVTNAADLDVVGEMNGMLAATDLFVATPQDIRSTVFSGGSRVDGQITGAYGELCLNNIKDGESNKLISGSLKTPKIQLGQIMQALDRSIDYTTAVSDGIANPIGPNVMPDVADMARAAFDQNVSGSRQPMPRSGIDTSRPISMQELAFMFPNLDVIPLEIPMASPWDATPQDAMTARNSMSSMLSASLSNLVPSCGLANILFRYSSYMTSGPMTTIGQGVWEILDYRMLVDMSPTQIENSIKLFENYFEMELTPILKVVRGDFDLLAHVDVMGYILIDLVFKDDYMTLNQHEGFYETSSRLGGFMNPMVADLGILNHNAIQLDTLVADTINKKLGPEQYFKPIIDPGQNNIPFGSYNPTMGMPQQQQVNYNTQPVVQGFETKTIENKPKMDFSSLL